jgi:hypothetical protein
MVFALHEYPFCPNQYLNVAGDAIHSARETFSTIPESNGSVGHLCYLGCAPAIEIEAFAPRAIPWSSARMTSPRAPAAMERGSIIASGAERPRRLGA